MNDALPPDDARLRGLAHRLRDHFERFGYRGIDTPILENLDLFLRKSGEEIAARMYSFTHWNRKLCLRPELTASVMRAYVNQMRDRPLPVRVHYAGPTFRYEKPQRGRYRQFTQVGIECIGGDGPSADAEVLAAACGAIEQVGLKGSRLVVGHLGVVLQLLEQLGIDEHGQNLILGNMEALARRGADPDEVVPRVLALMGVGSTVHNDAETTDDDDDERATSLLPTLLAEFGTTG
jgi:histidyl-tRNA synthetase